MFIDKNTHSAYIGRVRFSWDDKKNKELKNEGRPIFEEVLEVMAQDGVLIDGENPGHPGQRIYVLMIQDYPHVIPYEVRGEVFWLITVFPSRKFKR